MILRCRSCGSFTLHEECSCGGEAVTPLPPKYSPDDAYASYRREAKEEERREKGLI
ncbi:MAG: nucleolar RNA-binding Nop10p family protein [Nanobdellota archaeon]